MGQEYQMDGNLVLINDCGGFFTDSGGRLSDYSTNENFLTTICKDPREGTHVRVTFAKIDLAAGDKLCFYDGLDTSADSLTCIESFFNGTPIIVQATAANSSGCLTVNFISNSSGVAQGWEANLDCVPSCQLVRAEISSTVPAAQTIDNEEYIDICVGENIIFNGQGFYPQNNLVYEQSNANSIFEWDFGDGVFATGKSVAHTFTEGGGYRVTLKITDQFGCTNGNFAQKRVRVATKPNFKVGDLSPFSCIGDSIRLTTKIDGDPNEAAVAICNQVGSFIFSGVRSDSLALPDGNGASYKTSIRFTDFDSDQVLTDINDLLSICVNMEHSWLHDMEISITCPSGNTVLLQSQEVINKEVYLGNPIDNDGITPMAGRGADYCWTPTSSNGTITEFANENDRSGANDTYNLPAGNFESFGDLEELLGCPLNGDWVITVTDLWEQDNGWIFSWSMDINPDLYPDLETFQPQIIDFSWQNSPDFINNSEDLVIAQPNQVGEADYLLRATDDFGCTHDTVVHIEVIPSTDLRCLNCEKGLLQTKDVTICKGEPLDLKRFIDPYALGVKTKENTPDKTFSFTTNPPRTPYENPMQISNIPESEIREDGSNLVSVCIDLESEFNSDLTINLISPNGVFINLSSENGGRGKGYLNTCFTADAPQSIITQETVTFTGNYRPEEPFSNLKNSWTNGMWTLQLSDDAGAKAEDVNILKSWSMTFLSPDGGTFTWTPTDDLSCINCFDPVASPNVSTTYILEKNLDGCQVFDTLKVNVLGNDIGLIFKDYSLPDGQLLVSWEPISGVDTYEVSTDNLTWIPSSGEYFHIFSGLQQNDILSVFVRGVYEELGCQSAVTLENVQYRFCDVVADLGSHNLVTSCADTNDAFVVILANGGDQNYTFSLNGEDGQTNNRFDQLTAGEYNVLVEDTQACADTLTFTVQAPSPLNLVFDTTPIDCFGDDIGAAKVLFSGGVGGYEILQWSHTNSKSDTITNLTAGSYFVTVQDANNCSISDTLIMTEPSKLQALASAKNVSCFGKSDGAATVKVTDGTPPYRFNWSDGQSGSSAVGLSVGDYFVTIEDANNCKTERTVTVTQPPEITIDFLISPISCPDETDAALLAQVAGGIAPYTYRWSTLQTNQFTFGLGADRYFITVTDENGCEQTNNITIADPNPLVISTTFTPSSCQNQADGTATVNVVGGTAPYTFLWNDTLAQTTQTAINLKSAEYEVLVNDTFGCSTTQMVQVETASNLAVDFAVSPASCADRADGSAVANISGGSGSYNFLWSNGSTNNPTTNLLPGKYQVTIQDQNNCAVVDTVEITAPETLKLDSLRQTAPQCNGESTGALTAYISGGVAPYNYNWDNDQSMDNPYTGVPAGLHTLSVTDQNGCMLTPVDVNSAIQEPAPLKITRTQILPNPCSTDKLGQILLSVEGGTGDYSFAWSNGATTPNLTNAASGKYEVVITDANNCSLTDSFELVEPNALSGTVAISPISCFGDTDGRLDISTMGGVPPYQYSLDGENFNGIQNIIGLKAETYLVYIKDHNNCVWQSNSIKIINPPPFEVIIQAEENVLELGDSVELAAIFKNNVGNVQWDWSANTNETIDCPDNLCSQITVNPSKSTLYEIYAIDQNGCEANAIFNLSVENTQKIFVPTGFTPNGDGSNDYLVVHGRAGTVINSFKIFDRWGETIYESYEMTLNNIKNTWDGTFKGQPLNGGVYVWLLDVTFPNGTTEIYKGHTTLIK